MVDKFTVSNVMPTGEQSPTYGTKYYVKFAESEKTFELWYKTAPKEGDQVEGSIEGNKFKKYKKPYVSSQTESGEKPKRTYGAVEKDKQDGMRQGMCINNAANYVARVESDLTATGWANKVHEYATALYRLGDLKKEDTIEDAPANIQNVFGNKGA